MPILSRSRATSQQMHGATFTPLVNPSQGSQEISVWNVALPPRSPATPHEVTREEIFIVTSGRAKVLIGETVSIAAEGDVIVVPSDTTFSLEVAGDDTFESLVCLPVGGQVRMSDGTTFTPPWAQ